MAKAAIINCRAGRAAKGENHFAPAKKIDKFRLVDFLFKPQAWYGITRKRVWYRRRRMASPKVRF